MGLIANATWSTAELKTPLFSIVANKNIEDRIY